PTCDGFIVLAAHPGQGMVLMGSLDAAVVDENDPIASDPDLDMYDERNGYRPPPEPSHYSPEFVARYRAGQRARVARIDTIARRLIADANDARSAMRREDFRASQPAYRHFV